MAGEFWLDLDEQMKLKNLRDEISKIHQKHIENIKKRKDGKLSSEEMKGWFDQNKKMQDLQKQLKELLDKNPLLPENIMKQFKDWEP